MRVISGSARGRPLRAAAETRPTADLIKGAIFSMLEALAYKRGFEPDEDGDFAAALAWPRVVDLFAGSGALGIEALSRGAHFAEFIERDREAARIIASNLLHGPGRSSQDPAITRRDRAAQRTYPRGPRLRRPTLCRDRHTSRNCGGVGTFGASRSDQRGRPGTSVVGGSAWFDRRTEAG